MQGWIKLHRQITENVFYNSNSFDKTRAWIDLLLLASHKENSVFIDKKESIVMLKPGQLCYSQVSLSKRWKWNRPAVRKYLRLLKKLKMIDYFTDSVTTIITILNWNKYQQDDQRVYQQPDQQLTIRCSTNKNVKNVNNDMNVKNSVGGRYTRLRNGQVCLLPFNNSRNFFISYVKSKINPDYVFDAREGKHLKDILKKISEMVKSNGQTVTDDNIEETFRYIINNITDKWLLERFTLSKINSQFNETIQSIKISNGKDIDRTFDELAAMLYERGK